MDLFVAFASDVTTERKKVDDVVKALGPTIRRTCSHVHVKDWHDVVPDMGRAQQVIFNQLKPEASDLVILILWHRFGTPTGGRDDKGTPYPSGTYEEFITVFERWRREGKPRIMIYHCVRDVPHGIDLDQQRQVRQFLDTLKDPTSDLRSFVKTFRDHDDFFPTLLHDLQVVLLDSSAPLDHELPEKLRRDLIDYKSQLHSDRLIERIILEHCETLVQYIDDLNRNKLTRVSTLTLYETIRECLLQFPDVIIIDHDINRWNELIMPGDQIYNTFNYSSDILADTVTQARYNPGYKLRRVFVLTEDDTGKNATRTLQILNTIEEHIRDVAGQIAIRIYEIRPKPEAKDKRVHRLLRTLEDIVLVSSHSDVVVLREHISYETRRRAVDTDSEISIIGDDITNTKRAFEEVFAIATPLTDFLSNLNVEATPVGPKRKAPARKKGTTQKKLKIKR